MVVANAGALPFSSVSAPAVAAPDTKCRRVKCCFETLNVRELLMTWTILICRYLYIVKIQ